VIYLRSLVGLVTLFTLLVAAQEQPIQGNERETVRAMLSEVKDELKSHYYDAKFHGVDIDGRYKEAVDHINKATSLNQALGAIAWFMEGLHDSHTVFIPPARPFVMEQGWRMQMIGENCYVTVVKPGSDAEKKGLAPGDQIVKINGLVPTRADFHKIQYLFGVLRPQPGLELLVRGPKQEERTLDVAFQIRPTRHIIDASRSDEFWDEIRESQKGRPLYQRRSVVVGDTIVWKFPTFAVDEKAADAMIGDSMKYKSMIIDLRGNGGGSVETLLHLIRHFFDSQIKVADVQRRNKTDVAVAKSRSPTFTGKLVVLIDSRSASASEVFARVMQLEKRATILGDHSAGAVMEAELHSHRFGLTQIIYYATEITRANLIMADGKSLENVGGSPDIEQLPTPDDLHNGRDPALAKALTLVGQTTSPEEAGKFFPAQWRED
jgi:C-terminal processing protease CtpA/Prc